jgi:integrase/recombinase XerD
LATQAINRGVSLDTLVAVLGHRSLSMTLVYARLANRTVADEYFNVSQKVQALYDQPKHLPAQDEGSEMAKLHRERDTRNACSATATAPDQRSWIATSTAFANHAPTSSPHQSSRPSSSADVTMLPKRVRLGRQRVFDGLLARLQEDAS